MGDGIERKRDSPTGWTGTDAAFEWQATFDALPDRISIHDAHCRIIKCNAAFLAALNKKAEDVIGQRCHQLIHGTDGPIAGCPLMRSISSGKEETYTLEEDNSIYEVRAHPLPDASGGMRGCIHVMRDITEERRVHDRLEAQFLHLQTVVDTIPNPIFFKDTNLRFIGCNDAFARDIFGQDKAAIVGKELSEILPPQEAERHNDISRELLGSGKTQHYESRTRYKDGTIHELLVDKAALRDPSGKVIGLVGIITDITAEKKASAELQANNAILETVNRRLSAATERARELADKADQANRTKSQFLATMSHEIRTPLNGIIGMTDLLLEGSLPPSKREYAEILRLSAETLLGIVDEILDFSRIEAGRMAIERHEFDLGSIVEEAADILAAKAREKGLELYAFCDHDVPSRLLGDPFRIRQILINLGGNAVKFTEKGSVTIRASLESMSGSIASVRISVTDTGIGIPTEKLSALFQPFSQVDGSSSRAYGGAGLGLAISRSIAELMGGTLSVDSTPGSGSVFWLSLPLEAIDGRADLPSEPKGKIPIVVSACSIAATGAVATMLKGSAFDPTFAENSTAFARALASDPRPKAVVTCDAILDEFSADHAGVIKDIPLILIDSHPGRPAEPHPGTAAILTMPLKRRRLLQVLSACTGRIESDEYHEEAGQTDTSAARPAGRTPRILIVDDNAINRMIMTRMLAHLGVESSAASSGAEALDLLASEDFDALFLDLYMPGLDGVEVLKRIRSGNAGSRNPRIPTFVMTASVLAEDQERCQTAGIDGYLMKPVRAGSLMPIISRLIRDGGTPSPEKGSEAGYAEAELLDDLDGDRVLLGELARAYESTIGAKLEALDGAIAAADEEGVRRAAHAIVGTALSMHFSTLAQAARAVEADPGMGPDGLAAARKAIAEAEAEARSALRKILDAP